MTQNCINGKFGILLVFCLLTQCFTEVITESRHHQVSKVDQKHLVCTSEFECSVADGFEPKEKRLILTTLFVISLVATAANVGLQIHLKVAGCCKITPKACQYEKEFKNMQKEIDDKIKKMNLEYADADNTLVYIGDVNNNNRKIWFHLSRIMDLTEAVFRDLDPALENKYLTTSGIIKKKIAEQKENYENMGFEQLSTKYDGMFNSVESAAMRLGPIIGEVASVAVWKGLGWYKSYKVKQGIASNAAQLTNANMKARSVLGVKNVNTYLKSTATAQTKATAAVATLGKFAKFASGAASIISIAMDTYEIIAAIQGCKNVEKKMKEAVDKLTPEVNKMKESEKKLDTFAKKMQTEYSTVKSQITNAVFLNYLANVTQLGSSAHVPPPYMKKALQQIAFFKSNIKASSLQGTTEAQTQLIEALSKYTYTWSCYENQVRIISFVEQKCQLGQETIRSAYDQGVRHFIRIKDCTSAVGDKFVSFEKTKAFVEGQMKAKGLNIDCLLNNRDLILLACYYRAKLWDNGEIAGKTGLTETQVGIVFQRGKCPPQEVSPRVRSQVCRRRRRGKQLEEMREYYKYYDQKEIAKTYATCKSSDSYNDIITTFTVGDWFDDWTSSF